MQDGNTALHIAAINGHAEAVKLLTEHGADIHITNNVSWYTPIMLLIKYCIVGKCCKKKTFEVSFH